MIVSDIQVETRRVVQFRERQRLHEAPAPQFKRDGSEGSWKLLLIVAVGCAWWAWVAWQAWGAR